jgi:hypothetical protein
MAHFGNCKSCLAKDKNIELLESHNAYLKKIVDRLLAKNGVTLKKEKEEIELPSKEDEILVHGGEIYGG